MTAGVTINRDHVPVLRQAVAAALRPGEATRRKDEAPAPQVLAEIYDPQVGDGNPVSLVDSCVFPGRTFRRKLSVDPCDPGEWEYFNDIWIQPLDDTITTIPNKTKVIAWRVQAKATFSQSTRRMFVTDWNPGGGGGGGNGDGLTCEDLYQLPVVSTQVNLWAIVVDPVTMECLRMPIKLCGTP